MRSVVFVLLCVKTFVPCNGGSCTFPESWTGSWFQSGTFGITINSTHIQSKGDCFETDGNDKFLVYDRDDACYRCMVIREKHKYVLQYKETWCSEKDSLVSVCELITGDALLFSMFRKEPRPIPQPCPFHPAPFTFVYNRGSGECMNPVSRAELCTDDSRLLLRYMACPDVLGTENYVEELLCLATWEEDSTQYLLGQISQVHGPLASDEDTFRCYAYKGQHSNNSMTYNIAQSGDATCNGVTSAVDGSRTMKLTNSDDEHNRCHFPGWIVEHHKWLTLDHQYQYHFTTDNATLKVMNSDGKEEKRMECYSILARKENEHIKLVVHVTRGCEFGYVCLKFHGREDNVLELQQGSIMTESPQDACNGRDHTYTTLITTMLSRMMCHRRYSRDDLLSGRRRDAYADNDMV